MGTQNLLLNTEKMKSLGVFLDQSFPFGDHIEEMPKKKCQKM